MDRRQQRALRGLGASALAVFVAALFHTAGGGPEPTALAMGVSTVLAAPVSVLLAGRDALWRLALAVAASQFAFHFLFGLGQPSDVDFRGDGGMAGMPGMPGAQLTVSGGAAAGAASATAMWMWHAAAALVTIAALRHGDRVIRRMLDLAVRFLVSALRLLVRVASPRPSGLAPQTSPHALDAQFLLRAQPRRGPPTRFAR